MPRKSVVAQIAAAVTVSLIATVIYERFIRSPKSCLPAQTQQPRTVRV